VHWSDDYYGDLYFDSAADLLSPALSAMEAEVVARLLGLRRGERVLDLACGHGRHAGPLAALGARVVGLERNARYLRRAIVNSGGSASNPRWIRGDVRALPLREGAFDAAFSWYSSLFMYDDAANLACLAALGRVVRRGGRLLVHHANPEALSLSPIDASRRVLADGGVVEEESRWDAATGIDRCARRLVRPDGTVLAGTAELRYYTAPEWGPLAVAAGLRLVQVTNTSAAREAPGPKTGSEAPDLIAVLERPT
jgi:ubiquinone/menaquinone biosynthesis C-methylase UbiE